MKYVISLGGSAIIPKDSGIDIDFLKEFKEIILKSKHEFVIVCGGGQTARDYMNAVKGMIDEMSRDEIGIATTQLNAVLLSKILNARLVKTLDEVSGYKDRILVTGGFIPGITTDTDAVIIAEKVGSKTVINISDVKGVYDKDPNKYKDAKMYARMSYAELIRLANQYELGGKASFVFDLAASKLAERTKTKIILIKGLANLKFVLNNKPFEGTVVE